MTFRAPRLIQAGALCYVAIHQTQNAIPKTGGADMNWLQRVLGQVVSKLRRDPPPITRRVLNRAADDSIRATRDERAAAREAAARVVAQRDTRGTE
jgi:hypothetical protein